jgi:hypothetical protein
VPAGLLLDIQVVIEEGPEDGEGEEGPVLSNEDGRMVLEGSHSPEDIGTGGVPMGLEGEGGDRKFAGGIVVPEEVEDFNGTVEGTSIEGGPDRRDGRPEGVEVVDEGSLVGGDRNGICNEPLQGLLP